MSATLPVKNRQLFIDGAWVESSSGKKLPVTNSAATEETLAEISWGNRCRYREGRRGGFRCDAGVDEAHCLGPGRSS